MDKSVFRKLLNRPVDSHKYNYGHVLVVGGSPGMVGAPLISAMAALRMGAGLVTIASRQDVIDKLECRVLEIMTLRLTDKNPGGLLDKFIKEHKVSVVVVGPGTRPEFIKPIIEFVGGLEIPIIVDGGGLGVLSQDQSLIKSNFILTPHAGEFKRFEQDNPREFAKKFKITLVQKGQPSRIYSSVGDVFENITGGPALAKAGTGDMLTGLIAGLVAQHIEPFKAAQAAVYLGGLASDLVAEDKTVVGVLASDIIEAIPRVLASI